MYAPPSSAQSSLGSVEWIGCAVSNTLRVAASGRVHSVFGRACNLELDHTEHGPSLALLHPELPRTPWGLRLTKGFAAESATYTRMDHLFSPGELFKILPEKQELLFLASGLTLSFINARVWDAAMPAYPACAKPSGLWPCAESVAVLTSLLAAHTATSSLDAKSTQGTDIDSLVARRLAEKEEQIGAALRSGNGRRLAVAARDLMGFGPGLTPAGDDILVGVLAALWLQTAAKNPAVAALLKSLCQTIHSSAPDHTTPIAAVFMRHACAGLFAENVLDVLAALLHPHPGPDLNHAVHRLLAFGASSGADTLRGLVCACGALH